MEAQFRNVPDGLWEEIAPLIPARRKNTLRGRPPVPDREVQAPQVLRPQTRHPVEVVIARQRHGEGAKRGDLTGSNPTDRAKSGVKRHILTDGRGVPLAAEITGANIHRRTRRHLHY